MNKTHTLKELAEIGAKAAMLKIGDWYHTVTVNSGASSYESDRPAREAFTKAILDAIGYELPKDEEREAFDAWYATNADLFKSSEDECFTVWKAGRQELRKEVCSDKCEDTNKEPEWIPWSGGECPLPDTVKSWEMMCRDGTKNIRKYAKPKTFSWRHEEMLSDIIAYRVWE